MYIRNKLGKFHIKMSIKSHAHDDSYKYSLNAASVLPINPLHSLYVCLYVCMGAVVQLVEYLTCNQQVASLTHTRSTASNLEQVANLLCAQANSVSYPERDGKWVVAVATTHFPTEPLHPYIHTNIHTNYVMGWRPSVADWSDGVSASCIVDPIVH